MRILFCGDVVARTGREVIQKYVPDLRRKWKLDCVIANGENAQHGCGLTERASTSFFEWGVDVITTGNHVWDQKELFSYIEREPRVIRPINFAENVPGKGFYRFQTPNNKGDVLVINAMGQVFVRPLLDNPFPILENFLKNYPLGQNNLKAIIIDFHAEATSEKMALGFFLDGKISLLVGTHTHVPTADARILPSNTGYLTDAGMCGDYISIIGAPLEELQSRYLKKIPMTRKPDPAKGIGSFCGVYIETNDQTGLMEHISQVCLGPNLPQAWPQHLDAPSI